jgi:hypothetical protein
MNCDASFECRAKERPETPCWEIAREANDYRQAMSICSDCIVYMLKAEDSPLTDQEVETILTCKRDSILM